LNYLLILLVIGLSPLVIDSAYAQSSLNVTESIPCFLNYTSNGLETLQNCGFAEDPIRFVTMPFDWVTGGLFPLIVISVLIIMTYLKYQTGIYPIAIGVMWLPFSAWAYPDEFISYALVIASIIGAGAVLNAIIKQTKEYD
jgi:hypothetical protein